MVSNGGKEYGLAITRPNLHGRVIFRRHHDRAMVERALEEEREGYARSEPTAEITMVEREVGEWVSADGKERDA